MGEANCSYEWLHSLSWDWEGRRVGGDRWGGGGQLLVRMASLTELGLGEKEGGEGIGGVGEANCSYEWLHSLSWDWEGRRVGRG